MKVRPASDDPFGALLRPHIRALVPYASARDDYAGTEGVFLDANENAYGSVTATPYHRYPDPYQRAVKARLAQWRGVSPEQIFLGNGSDEAIDLLIRAFCRPGHDNVLTLPPTYGMYAVSARLHEAEVREIPLTSDFQPVVSEVLAQADAASKLLFLCSPNNPSGNLLDEHAVATLLTDFPGVVVLDEAYIDFCPERSWLSRLDQYPRLVILQTFSKAWGMAALRLGVAYAHPDLIRVLNRIKPPYNLNEVTQQAALTALAQPEAQKALVHLLKIQRTTLTRDLQTLPLVREVFPSEANFLLVRMHRAAEVFAALLDQKIIVRDRSRVSRCENCLRITVGTAEENQVLLAALQDIGQRFVG